MTGLFGYTVVGWCQLKSIPVGDFSRQNVDDLPKEPNLFELRVPSDPDEGAAFVASAFRGFRDIRSAIEEDENHLDSQHNLADILARLLGRNHLESEFALYMSRLGSANSIIAQRLRDFSSPNRHPTSAQKAQVLSYVLGHVVSNSVLRFPGPILSSKALAAYVSTCASETEVLQEFFRNASYTGPFSDKGAFFWREDVDEEILAAAEDGDDLECDDFGDLRRAIVERSIGRELKRHACDRDGCEGKKGGFLCPFTGRTVCQREDCSVGSISWIPQGALVCRVERDFYDEWAPLLGV